MTPNGSLSLTAQIVCLLSHNSINPHNKQPIMAPHLSG